MSLMSHCAKLQMPNLNKLVYKEECLYSFDTPENCPDGLFVSLTSYMAVGKESLDSFYFPMTQDPFYLNYKQVYLYTF